MAEVAALLLAAGLSRRMGPNNKLLLPIGSRAMIRVVAETYRHAIDGPIVVVTGHQADRVESALAGLDLQCVYNPDYGSGQHSSVAFGLSRIAETDLLLIGLGDQPVLQIADLHALIAAHEHADPKRISIPGTALKRGNPIAVPRTLRPRLTADPERPGCMRFTRTHPEQVQFHALTAAGFYRDIDTQDDYAALATLQEYAE